MRILLVEDDAEFARRLAGVLRRDGYAVDVACDGPSADELEFVNNYDLIELDWTIPPPTGIELLQRWRGSGDGTPVLMLTGQTKVEARVSGLDSGADDLLIKPFSLDEFMARVRSLLRRRERPMLTSLHVGEVSMDRARHRVTVNDKLLQLSPKEFAMLEYFLHRPDEVISREQLLEHVWDNSFDAMSNVVDVTIFRLRAKLDSASTMPHLQTVKGIGYVLRAPRC